MYVCVQIAANNCMPVFRLYKALFLSVGCIQSNCYHNLSVLWLYICTILHNMAQNLMVTEDNFWQYTFCHCFLFSSYTCKILHMYINTDMCILHLLQEILINNTVDFLYCSHSNC